MDNIIELAERLQREVDSCLESVKDIESKEKHLTERDLGLVEKEKRIVNQQQDIDRQKALIEQEKGFIKIANEKIAKNIVTDEKLEEKRNTLIFLQKEVEEKQKSVQKDIDLFKNLQQQKKALEDRELAIQIREEKLRKIATLQQQRADIIDRDDKTNKAEAQRLQRIAESISR